MNLFYATVSHEVYIFNVGYICNKLLKKKKRNIRHLLQSTISTNFMSR